MITCRQGRLHPKRDLRYVGRPDLGFLVLSPDCPLSFLSLANRCNLLWGNNLRARSVRGFLVVRWHCMRQLPDPMGDSKCVTYYDDRGQWQQVEAYIAEHSEASFTHGMCQECHEKGLQTFRRQSQ
jgi:hypothetical protein